MTKAMLFQLSLRQDMQAQGIDTSPLSGSAPHESTHSRFLHAIEAPFKRIPKHFPHFHHDTKPEFLIVNEVSPSVKSPESRPVPAPASGVVVAAAEPAPINRLPSPLRPGPISSLPLRPRRHSAPELPRTDQDAHLRPKRNIMLRRYRSLDSRADSRRTKQLTVPERKVQIVVPSFNPILSPQSAETDSTNVDFADQPESQYTPDIGDFLTTSPSTSASPGSVEPPLGLSRFERPKLILRTADLPAQNQAEWTPQKPESATQVRRQKLRKQPTITRDIKISAPATLNDPNSFLDLEGAPPRTPPLPPPSVISRGDSPPLTEPPVVEEVRGTNTQTGPDISRPTPVDVPKKKPRLITVAKVAGRLLKSQASSAPSTTPSSSTSTASPPPPLLYSASTPIQQHIHAISTRVKEEFKMKLNKELELPLKDEDTEEEFIQQLGDVNEDIGQCAKAIAKLLSRSPNDKRESKAFKSKKSMDAQGEVRTMLNSFLVARVFQPFSIQLSIEDDEAVRARYNEIAPSVPQFIASRWRVIASASTSRPVQELGSVLRNLATELSFETLGERSSDADLAMETTEILLPLIRHAYLLAHFNHLKMITSDYEIFAGTDLGGWVVPSLEEEKWIGRYSVSKSQDGRVTGYWSLGLKKKRYVGEGAFQRRVWDVLLKSQVLTSRTL